MSNRTPSPHQIQRALEQYREARDRLLAIDANAPDDEKLWHDMLDAETDQPFAVIDRLVETALDAEAKADAIAVRRKALAARAARFSGRAENMRSIALMMLETLGLKRIEREAYSAFITTRSHVIVTDLAALPDSMKRVTVEPRKLDIGKALKDGEVVPGAELSNAEASLTIRTI